jgi:hypothetical protein
MHAHIFKIFYFFIFFLAGLDPASPARSLAQASDPAGQSMRELVHACMAQCEGN